MSRAARRRCGEAVDRGKRGTVVGAQPQASYRERCLESVPAFDEGDEEVAEGVESELGLPCAVEDVSPLPARAPVGTASDVEAGEAETLRLRPGGGDKAWVSGVDGNRRFQLAGRGLR